MVHSIASDLHSLSHNLHPAVLQKLGLERTLQRLCEETSAHYEVVVDFASSSVPPSLQGDVAITLFRIAQEALQNVVKHSAAKRATVRLSCNDGSAVLFISDLGRGFDPDEVAPTAGLGLTSMRARVQPFGGKVFITSSPRRGTTVRVEIPMEAIDGGA